MEIEKAFLLKLNKAANGNGFSETKIKEIFDSHKSEYQLVNNFTFDPRKPLREMEAGMFLYAYYETLNDLDKRLYGKV